MTQTMVCRRLGGAVHDARGAVHSASTLATPLPIA